MNCGRVSNQLSAYLDRELTGAEMLSIRSHLGDCASCRAEYEALGRMKTMLGRLRTPEPGPELVAAAARRFEQAVLGGAASTGWSSAGRLPHLLRRLSQSLYPNKWRAERLSFWPDQLAASISHFRYATARECATLPAWPRVTLGVTTAALAAALLFTTIGWRKPRHPDALLATIPPQVALGQDMQGQEQPGSQTLEFDLVSQSRAGDPFRPDLNRGRFSGSFSALPWVPVTFESDGLRRLR